MSIQDVIIGKVTLDDYITAEWKQKLTERLADPEVQAEMARIQAEEDRKILFGDPDAPKIRGLLST